MTLQCPNCCFEIVNSNGGQICVSPSLSLVIEKRKESLKGIPKPRRDNVDKVALVAVDLVAAGSWDFVSYPGETYIVWVF